jgi:hypothetical protein
MRRRAAAIGGRIVWASAPGAGCRVELTMPLPAPRDEAHERHLLGSA